MGKRPTGVTILGATATIAGILMFFNGIGMISSAALQPMPMYNMMGIKLEMPFHLASTMLYGLGVIMTVVGIASIFVAYGLLKGYGWAWTGIAVFTSTGIVVFIISLATLKVTDIANIIINGSILYYLFRPHVKEYFGKTAGPTSSTVQTG